MTTVDFIFGLPMEMQNEVLNDPKSAKALDNRRDFDILLKQ